MVIKGGSRSGAGGLAAHLLRTDTNERAEVLELHGVIADRLPEALREMEAVATGTRCKKPLYHASINTGPGEELTLEQKAAAVARLELALGLEGHARAVVEHRKEGRDHLHVVWSRIDSDTLRATHDGHNYRKHEEVARELEREFGHNRVQGAHAERDGPDGDRRPRPPRTPSPGDVQQATRTKRGLGDVGAELNRLWREADTGPAFAAALNEAGYVLAQGDRRGFCVVDQAGAVHSLARRIEGVKTRDVNARLVGIELGSLPTVDQARAIQQDRQLPDNERPAWRLALELTRPLDERTARTERQGFEDERAFYAKQQIRVDLDQHTHDQAEKRPQPAESPPSPEEARRSWAEQLRSFAAEPAAEPRPSPEEARRGWAEQLRSFAQDAAPVDFPPWVEVEIRRELDDAREGPERDRGEAEDIRPAEPTQDESASTATRPDERLATEWDHQIAGSANYRAAQPEADGRERGEREPSEEHAAGHFSAVESPMKEAGNGLGGAADLLGAGVEKGLGGFLGMVDRLFSAAMGRSPDKENEKDQDRPAKPEGARDPKGQTGKARPAPEPPPRSPPANEGAAPTDRGRDPTRERDRDRSRFEARPIIRMFAGLGRYVGWAILAKERLRGYGLRTSEDVSVGLRELDDIIYFAGHSPKPT